MTIKLKCPLIKYPRIFLFAFAVVAQACVFMAWGFAGAAEGIIFPLGVNDGVSATFGEYRSNHLHAGVDFRTKRRTGIPVLAPADGKVSRLYGDENGYGLMLEFSAENGFKYKFAHLASFENETLGLMDAVRAERAKSGRRFNFEVDLSGRNVFVKAGRIIAFSGDTGAGPPHLHFEMADRAGNIVNPFGRLPFESVAEETPVKIVSVLFMPQDENSLVEGEPVGRAFQFDSAAAAAGGGCDLAVRAVGKLKIAVRAFDENRVFPDNESRTGVYGLQLKETAAGGGAAKIVYALRFDSMDAAVSRMPETVYDMYYSNISSGNFYYKLFETGAAGKAPAFVEAAAGGGGVVEIREGETRYFEITAADYFNNFALKTVKITGGGSKSPAPPPSNGPGDGEGALPAGARGGTGTRPPGENIPIVEYSDNVIIFKIGAREAAAGAVITRAGKEMKKFDRAGYRCFYAGYENFAASPSICVETPAVYSAQGVGDRETARDSDIVRRNYSLKIYRLDSDKPVAVSSDGSFMAQAESAAGRGRPVYAGKSRLESAGRPADDETAAANPASKGAADNFIDLSFSGPVRFAAVYARVPAETAAGGQLGIYNMLSKAPVFMGNEVVRIGGESYLCARAKNVRRLKCALGRDEKPPSLKITKKSGARLAKPVKPAANPENDYLSFYLADAESGVSRRDIKYFVDGAESGNFEYFAGGLLNCYLYDLKTGAGLAPGEHSIKVAAADNCGNQAVYEKSFRVVGAVKEEVKNAPGKGVLDAKDDKEKKVKRESQNKKSKKNKKTN